MQSRHGRHCNLPLAICLALALPWASCSGGGSSRPSEVLTLIQVTPQFESVMLGKTMQFTATGTYSTLTGVYTKDITTLVAWSSSNENMVTIDSAGVATPHATGGVTVTATLGAVSGSTLVAVTPDASARLVWFTPDIGSTDMLDLFSHPEEWPNARASVQVFKFYNQQITPPPYSCGALCGTNTETNLASVGAFSTLSQWGLDIGQETGAVKWWGCTADVSSAVAISAIQALRSNGGVLSYIAMDEPLAGGQDTVNGQSCNYTMEQSAAQTVRFIQLMHAFDPTLQIGDIECYPCFSEPQLESWIAMLQEGGVALPFFHLDLDLNGAAAEGLDAASDIKRLQSFCESQGIALGVIFIEQLPNSDGDQTYYNSTLQEIQTIKAAIGMPQHSIFQSWMRDANGVADIPINLPENDPTIYSHTRLINAGLAALAP